MQKQAIRFSLTTLLFGAVGLLMRWLQTMSIFDAETGLPTPNAPISFLVALVILAAILVLWRMSGKLYIKNVPEEPEELLALPEKAARLIFIFAGIVTLAGSAMLFFTADSLLLRIVALLGILSVLPLLTLPYLSHWGGFGVFLSTLPTLFFSLWLVAFYRDNAIDPTLWAYCVQILSISACLFAVFRVASRFFYRMNARITTFACSMGVIFSLMMLMDDTLAASKLIMAGWCVGIGGALFLLLWNLGTQEDEY